MATVFSPCRTWRYRLDREFLFGGPTVAFMLHNPSTADEQSEDRTSGRGIGFARAWGAGRLVFVNPWAFCATDKADLWKAPDPVGPENDRHIAEVAREVARTGGYFIAAWGSVSPPKELRAAAFARLREIERVIREAECPLKALAVTASGAPRHPLYLRGDSTPIDWPPRRGCQNLGPPAARPSPSATGGRAEAMLPEPCLKRCRSPVACQGWGYCRERNMDDRGAPTPEQIKERRTIATSRAAGAADTKDHSHDRD